MFDSWLRFLDGLLEWIIQACGRVVLSTVNCWLNHQHKQLFLYLIIINQQGAGGFPYDSLNLQTQSKVGDEKD